MARRSGSVDRIAIVARRGIGSRRRRRRPRRVLPPAVQILDAVDEFLRRQPMEGRLQPHELRDLARPFVAVIERRMPQWRILLLLPDMSVDAVVLGLAELDAVAGGHVLVLEVAIARAGLGRHEHQMPHRPELGTRALRMKPGDFFGGNLATRIEPAAHGEGMAVAEGVARTELDVIARAALLPGLAGHLPRFGTLRRFLRLGGGFAWGGALRVRRRNLRSHGECERAEAQKEAWGASIHQLALHYPLPELITSDSARGEAA